MSGTICRALGWTIDECDHYVAIPPLGTDVALYRLGEPTHFGDTNLAPDAGDPPQLSPLLGPRGGLAEVLRRLEFHRIQCSAYDPAQFGTMAVGTFDQVYVFDLRDKELLVLQLRTKPQRLVNCLAFGSNHLLAVGSDKSRQDYGLQLWNLEHYSRTGSNDHIQQPMYQYAVNEQVRSVCFFPPAPLTNANPNPYLHPANASSDDVPPSTLLVCGTYKLLRGYDIRMPDPAMTFQVATQATLGLAVDPWRPHYFSLYAEDGTICVWDHRRLARPLDALVGLLLLSEPQPAYLNTAPQNTAPALLFNKLLVDIRLARRPCLRHLLVRAGEFSTVFNGDHLRRWNLAVVPGGTTNDAAQLDAGDEGDQSDLLFVTYVLDAKATFERVVLFDYMVDPEVPTRCRFLCMRQLGNLYTMDVQELPDLVRFNAFNEFTVTAPTGVFSRFVSPKANAIGSAASDKRSSITAATLEDKSDDESEGEDNTTSDTNTDKETATNGTAPTVSSIKHEPVLAQHPLPAPVYIPEDDLLDRDICLVMRQRAVMGYGVDPEANMELVDQLDGVANNKLLLRNCWRWVLYAQQANDKGRMRAHGLDLGYEGVLGIWNGALGLENQDRYDRSRLALDDGAFGAAAREIVAPLSDALPVWVLARQLGHYSKKKEAQRRLCLEVAGWDMDKLKLDERLQNLVDRRRHAQAAGLAVFHGDIARAIEILGLLNDEMMRVMLTAVAGYFTYSQQSENNRWREQCRRMALDLKDPYLRAIFAYIADSDWWDVLDERLLPLRERLGVALRFLPDKDLGVYLTRMLEQVIETGELEGLVVTGITPLGADLLQLYVDRTLDVQTASLLALFGLPKYFQDQRVDQWVDCYRRLLNSWSLFNARAKFDVARTRLLRDAHGVARSTVMPRQMYLQCIRCNKNVFRSPSGASPAVHMSPLVLVPNLLPGSWQLPPAQQVLRSATTLSTPGSTGLQLGRCPHCGAALPRCAVCLLSLGMPIPVNLLVWDRQQLVEQLRFKEWLSYCLSCNHGMHLGHAEEWFSTHMVCPVPGCHCQCNTK